ncbi:alanine racemase [Ihubacter massiliensis]|uniref:Alanine racemase n=1 Tax=Hominibacterium faecale TaxID=2839743 RepID=A0A9J6QPC8_9FIRM|nr:MULTISPECIES: alanine racemase [Eubacteriales Family XIII. Incertae Sedis]MCC2864428.1 alanine racemase [Anaerovorax odorimutans]MCO7124049.1 alanine racemase [Ihubacter massiliensis]MCU7379041.1 alanine racemase [Hominibacterium faecale]
MLISESYVGKHYSELPDPCLIVDLDKLDENIKIMQEYVSGHTSCVLRPHIKTHKCPAIANMQISAGAAGITCAKIGEAEVMAMSGIKNILIANQIVSPAKIKVLAGLNRYCDVSVCVDDKINIDALDYFAGAAEAKIPVLVELDIVQDRCGTRTAEETLELARYVSKKPNLIFKGMQSYEGRFPDDCRTEEAKKTFVKETTGFAAEVKGYLQDSGVPVEILSGVSTSTVKYATQIADGMTEVQAGSYVFMESAYDPEMIGLPLQQSLYIVTKICSMYGDRIVLTAGEKSITNDQGQPLLADDPQTGMDLNEEHCLVDRTDKLQDCRIGDTMLVIPSHCCTTVNLHDYLFAVRSGIVEAVWPVSARGRSY